MERGDAKNRWISSLWRFKSGEEAHTVKILLSAWVEKSSLVTESYHSWRRHSFQITKCDLLNVSSVILIMQEPECVNMIAVTLAHSLTDVRRHDRLTLKMETCTCRPTSIASACSALLSMKGSCTWLRRTSSSRWQWVNQEVRITESQVIFYSCVQSLDLQLNILKSMVMYSLWDLVHLLEYIIVAVYLYACYPGPKSFELQLENI